ncbi:hypothetical protein [Paenibacillus pabuli]|uniref:hypothetical protein n=1 Tax=Paenibacillus pabuli TaxID=1472 RepID=UPI001FFF3471|nr:hypothetical protein [Paenibacillus pabuli]UPK45948.1 hypothetical protein KET34_11065 [Paenibacillus pabuli]
MIDIINEDRALIKSHIILPRVLTAFERDIALINTTLKTPGPYVNVIAEAQRKITADIYEIRKQSLSAASKSTKSYRIMTE